MPDNANPSEGATGEVINKPSGPIDYDTAASMFEAALDREEQQAQPRDDDGRFARRDGAEPPDAEDESVEAGEEEAEELEAEAEGDEADTEVAEDAEETGEEAKFASVEELAEALNMPVDDFMGEINVTVKIDGKTETLPLSEVRDGYQRQADYTRSKQTLAEQRKALEAEREKFRDDANNRLTEIGGLVKGLEEQFVSDYQSVNWQELRVTDPAEFAARRQEFAERVQWIEGVKQNAQQEASRQQEALNEQQQQQLQETLAKEASRLVELIPAWQDESVAKTEKANIRTFLQANGYIEEEVNSLYDSRAVALVRKAMLFDQGEQSKDVAKKKVKKLPKLQKAGPRRSKKENARRQADTKLAALKKSGKVDDAAAAIFDIL